MKSIRFSLVVYFLLLVAVTFCAVAWFVYDNTSRSLKTAVQRQETLLQNQTVVRIREAKDSLDSHIVRQAQTLAKLARATRVHTEILYPLGATSCVIQPQGYLTMPLWLAPSPNINRYLFFEMWKRAPLHLRVNSADALVPTSHHLPSVTAGVFGLAGTLQTPAPLNAVAVLYPADGHKSEPTEYFQTFDMRGRPLQRSKNLRDGWFDFPERLLGKKKFAEPVFDDLVLANGTKVRRVTLKAQVRASRPNMFSRPRWRSPRPPGQDDDDTSKGKGKSRPGKKSGPPREGNKGKSGPRNKPPPERRDEDPVGPLPKFSVRYDVFIQYGIDKLQHETTIAQIEKETDQKTEALNAEYRAELASLRLRLFLIGVIAFAAVVVGGFALVHFGLTPLRRLSDAVSRVSERDFRLQIDDQRLSQELQPIVERLVETLSKLERAFSREKQAAADISHELRTPLAALMTNLNVALRKDRTIEQYREVLEDCRSSGKQMTQLVERLLALARLDAGVDNVRPQDVDVSDLAMQCASVVRPLAEARGLELRLHADTPTPLVADPAKIREILNNLLHNAIQYNKPNGKIDLSVQRVNGCVAMAVRDTGIGISAEQREHIFERFYRADPSRHAEECHAGLGLSIVKGYVDLMGATIDVESGNDGTTFQIEFPADANYKLIEPT